jgi:hypothetical protein
MPMVRCLAPVIRAVRRAPLWRRSVDSGSWVDFPVAISIPFRLETGTLQELSDWRRGSPRSIKPRVGIQLDGIGGHPFNNRHSEPRVAMHFIQPVDAPLYVVTPIVNPSRYQSRYRLYEEFAKYIADAGAILYTVEAAYGDRAFEVTDAGNPRHVQLRTTHELWHKENLINIGVTRLPADWKYVAWIDADVQFTRNDIVAETIHQLQHFPVVQMFSHAMDLGPQYQPLQTFGGFVAQYLNQPANQMRRPSDYGAWHPGYAWASRRDAWNHLGGLIDFAVVGSGDRYMACAFLGDVEACLSAQIQRRCPTYTAWCGEWQARAERHVQRNIGYVEGLLTHYFHGAKKNRGYVGREEILWRNGFDPSRDIKRDWQGLLQLTDQKFRLRDNLRAYFRSRNEDSTSL